MLSGFIVVRTPWAGTSRSTYGGGAPARFFFENAFQGLDEGDEHADDAPCELLCVRDAIFARESAVHEFVQRCRDFGSRSARDVEEPDPVAYTPASRALGDIPPDRFRGATRVVRRFRATRRQLTRNRVNLPIQLPRDPINLQSLMIENVHTPQWFGVDAVCTPRTGKPIAERARIIHPYSYSYSYSRSAVDPAR